jgi:hypothetical protein
MTTHLVLVHGRAQEDKDGLALKHEWMRALDAGLAKSGLQLPVSEDRIHFPYYGQALYDMWAQVPDREAARVTVMGASPEDAERRAFLLSVLQEVQRVRGITDRQVRDQAGFAAVERGPLQWEWVQAILAAIDRHVPGASGAGIALATNDVYEYLHNRNIAGAIRNGVRAALPKGEPAVVVSHSLGTVVAYDLLRREGEANGWQVPLFVTLGSPLGVTAIRRSLQPLAFPACARQWLNAMDQRDVVALYSLDRNNFGVDPPIDNQTDVDNATPNHHGIAGYLDNAVVARRIYAALGEGASVGISTPDDPA